MFSLSNLVVHTFEPRTEKEVDNELIIDADTKWVATCQQDDPKSVFITNQMYERLILMYQVAEAKSKKLLNCVECAVINFREELELLDFMPLREVIMLNEKDDDTLDEGLDETD